MRPIITLGMSLALGLVSSSAFAQDSAPFVTSPRSVSAGTTTGTTTASTPVAPTTSTTTTTQAEVGTTQPIALTPSTTEYQARPRRCG